MKNVKVTIGIPVYNSEKYISTCLDSILAQTMLQEDIEIIVVNDGSTDKSGEILEHYSQKLSNMILLHQDNSGGPGLPRNKMIEMASGEYIFFVDIDDYLGPEAIERLYKMGVSNQTDIILGKMVGVNGRDVAKSMFQFNQKKTDIYQSTIINTLGPTKMFRSSFLRDENIWFPIGTATAEDQPFMLKAYILANGISIVADYPSYYVVQDVNRNHASSIQVNPKEFYQTINNAIDMIHTYSPDKEKRDILLVKYLKREFNTGRSKTFCIENSSFEEKELWLTELKIFVEKNITEEIEQQLTDKIRARLFFIKESNLNGLIQFLSNEDNLLGEVVNGRIILNHPPNLDLPITFRDITNDNKVSYKILSIDWNGQNIVINGYIYSSYIKSDSQTASAILVNRQTKEEMAFPVSIFSLNNEQLAEYKIPNHAVTNSGFLLKLEFKECMSVLSELSPLDLFIELKVDGYKKRVRIGKERIESVANKFLTSFTDVGDKLIPVIPYYTKDYDNLSFDIGSTVKSFTKVELEDSYWDQDNHFHFKALLSMEIHPGSYHPRPEVQLLIKERDRAISFITDVSFQQIRPYVYKIEKSLQLLKPLNEYHLNTGYWYFSIILKMGDYSKTIRFGVNKKEQAKKIEKEVLFEANNKSSQAKGYFTKPYGNLSLEIKEIGD